MNDIKTSREVVKAEKDKPFFSIIIPVYNVAPYLRECLDSVLSQTFADWECLCVDDGSIDESGVILDEYAQRDVRFRIIHQKNAGLPVARNAGIRIAKGEYVCFIDSDDVVLASWLFVANTTILGTNADVVRLYLQDWDGAEKKNFVYQRPKEVLYKTRKEIFSWGWSVFIIEAWSVLLFVNKKVFNNFCFTEKIPIHEDAIFAMGLLNHVESICVVDFPGYLYRQRANSIMQSGFSVWGILKFFTALQNEMLQQKNILQNLGIWDDVIAKYSEILYTETRGWTLRRISAEKHNFSEIAKFLRKLRQEKVLRMQNIKIVWRPLFLFFCYTSLWQPLYCAYVFAIFIKRLRRRC